MNTKNKPVSSNMESTKKKQYKVGQIVDISSKDWDATTGVITKIEYDLKGEYGSYLIESKNPFYLGWLNDAQVKPIIN